MGDTTTTNQTTQTSGPSNPDVQATTTKLAQKLGGLADRSPAAFDKSLYAGVGPTTQSAWTSSLAAANNPDYMSGVNGAIKSFGSTAAGNDFGMNDPGYATLRQKAIDDAIKNVGAGFVNSGRFGGGSYTDAATTGAFNAAAGLDYTNYQNDIQRQQQAASILPSLYGAAQQPAATQGAVGAAQDADKAAALQGQYDLYTRQQEAPLQWLQGVTSAAAGNAATSPQQQTSSTNVPWWMAGLGALSTGAGLYGSFQK